MRRMQLMMAAINPGKAKGLEEVATHVDRWESKVLALLRDFNEELSEEMRAAILISMLPPDLQHALIQQADKINDYKSTRDRVTTIVEAKLALKNPDALGCDAVHWTTGHTEAWEEESSEACDVDAVNSKGGLFCYRCGGQGHIAAKCATPAPAKGKGKDGGKGGKAGGKGAGNKGKGKGEWNAGPREDRRWGDRGGYRRNISQPVGTGCPTPEKRRSISRQRTG